MRARKRHIIVAATALGFLVSGLGIIQAPLASAVSICVYAEAKVLGGPTSTVPVAVGQSGCPLPPSQSQPCPGGLGHYQPVDLNVINSAAGALICVRDLP